MRTFTQINLGNIRENPLNIHNNDDDDQIQLMADSISEIGLQNPLVVYEDNYAGKKVYTILSGHKRYRALIRSGKPPIFSVPCVVEDKPADEMAERELLLQNNMARKDPEEIQRQALEASAIWSRMSPERRERYAKQFEARFIIEQKKKGGRYDPAFIKDNFRPRLEYIRKMTGLSVCNRTVTNILRKELEKTSEALPVEPTKEKAITIKDIIKRANSLSGIISVYMDGDIKSEELPYLTDLQTALQETTTNIAV